MIKIAWISLLFPVACAGFDVQTSQDQVSHEAITSVEVYAAVLQHIQTYGHGLPIKLNEELTYAGHSEGPPECPRHHTPDVIHGLEQFGVIRWSCRVQTGEGCQPRPTTAHLYVRLGPVLSLPADAHVKVIPPVLPPGLSVDEALARVPDGDTEPVDTAVDVVVNEQSRDEIDRESDVIHYRYFLRMDDSGRAHVVTRWISGYI